MSTELKTLQGRVVYTDPVPGQRKITIEPAFTATFRTTTDLRKEVIKWAVGQWKSAAGLHVEVRKPSPAKPSWTAEVLRGGHVLAKVVFHPPKPDTTPSQEAIL